MSSPFHPDQIRRYFESRLPAFRANGRAQVSLRCPFHDDSDPSFSLNLDEGIWKCQAGCGSGGVLAFEEKFSGCDREQAKAAVNELLGMSFGPEPETIYVYRNAQGDPVFRKLRYPGKKFVSQRPTAAGGWENGLNGVSIKPLYNLPEVVCAAYVVVTEGEKDADRLTALNLSQFDPKGRPVAVTTNFDGAGHWRPEYNPYFSGKQITIFPDNDPIGQDHAVTVARGIYPFVAGVKIVSLDLPEHGDVSDYLNAGHTAEELIAKISEAPAWQPDAGLSRYRSVAEIRTKGSGKAEWILPYVERSSITSLSAKIKTGKSSLIMSGCKAVLDGGTFLGQPVTRGPVVLISEMAGAALIAALDRAGLQDGEGLRIMQPHDSSGLNWPQIVASAEEECRRVNAVLLIIDTLNWFSGLIADPDENSAVKMLEVMRPLQAPPIRDGLSGLRFTNARAAAT